ncbi:alpha/beta fold hydrolase [Gordonia westfalica]|uniref:Alpha/beta fold hydrolase n=1 Tax=Gordonia westfalica TaxID=158898 RepID=A0ABU2H0W0_9ACTN|nr:alpha/beta fold hydrolase [Gordonia westfalica]MDS1116639.1 alpha/beta fold hydrolase [Gordonia westfalica]
MKIVFLHGVGDGNPKLEWLDGLNRGLARIDCPQVSPEEVIAPRYSHLLNTDGIKSKHPGVTYKVKNDHDSRRAFERRQARVQRMLRRSSDVRVFGLNDVPDVVVEAVQAAGISVAPGLVLKQVRRYLSNEDLRGAVLGNILDDLPSSGEIVLIGHSLGSVIAIDLLDHLPEQLHVKRFITIGSPAGSEPLHRGSDRILKRFPYARVDDWSNFLDPRDPVTAGRGLARIFPGAQDFQIGGAAKHSADLYLRHPAIARLVNETIHGVTASTETSAENAVVLRLGDQEAGSLLALAYANNVAAHISDKDTKDRYEDALDVLQDNFVQELLSVVGEGRQLPPEFAELAKGRVPSLPRRWDLTEAVTQAVVLAFTNAVDPYEIEVGEARVKSLPNLFVELGFRSGIGDKVKDAVNEVTDCLNGDKGLFGTKTRIMMAAAGVALLAAGPIGLAVAGSATAVGAAAITSSLAAFGPGGMVGGLAMLGGLASTGAVVTTAAATVRGGAPRVSLDPTSIAIQVATAHALKKVGEPHDADLWTRLALAESQISAQLNRLSTFSDEKAPAKVQLANTLSVVEKLMQFIRDNHLMPQELEMLEAELMST